MSNDVSRWTADGSEAPDDMRDLLRSGKLDDPSQPQVDALWAKLQPVVGPGGGEGSGPDGAEGGTDAPAPVPSVSLADAGTSAAGAGAATWVRPLVTALIAGAAISTSAVWVGEQNPRIEPVERTRSEVSAPPIVVAAVPREVPDADERAGSPSAQQPKASPPIVRERADAPRGTASKSDAAVAAPAESEAEFLQRAHAALRSGLASQALSMANEHARLYPRGVLSQERELILVQALVQLGRRQDAIARTESFLRQYPNSAHARRLRTVLGLAEPPETDPAKKSPDEVIMSDEGVHSQPERFETGVSKP